MSLLAQGTDVDEAAALDQVVLAVRDAAEAMFAPYPQVRMLDAYSLFAVSLPEEPSVMYSQRYSKKLGLNRTNHNYPTTVA